MANPIKINTRNRAVVYVKITIISKGCLRYRTKLSVRCAPNHRDS